MGDIIKLGRVNLRVKEFAIIEPSENVDPSAVSVEGLGGG